MPDRSQYFRNPPPTPAPAPAPRQRSLADRIWRVSLILVMAWLVLFVGVLVGFRLWFPSVVQEFQEVWAKTSNNTLIFDRNDKLLAAVEGLEDRHTVPIERISIYLQKAVIAVEDRRFFGHRGLDPIRLVGAFWANLRSMAYAEGGSTITQQLVKLTLLSPERTMLRKIREIFMAIALELEYSKLKLLEFYLNRVYLGYGLYGIEKASQAYFHSSAAELDLNQAAFLAALIKKPEGFLRYPEEQQDAGSATLPLDKLQRLQARKNRILRIVGELGWVQRAEARAMQHRELTVYRPVGESTRAPYFVQHVQKNLRSILGTSRVAGRGFRVYTTLDSELQQRAETTVAHTLGSKAQNQASQAAVLAMEPTTGFVRVMVGGSDYSLSQFNRATQALRQPGSAFKPLLYAAALENGFTPNTVFVDEPVRYVWGAKGGMRRLTGDQLNEEFPQTPEPEAELEAIYEPRNYNDLYGIPLPGAEHEEGTPPLRERRMILARALERSSNVIAVRLLDELGLEPVAKLAERAGLKLREKMGLCIALGCSETALLELTAAYSIFANGGLHTRPVFIRKITNLDGKLLYEHISDLPVEVISSWNAYQMREMLGGVINRGTGRRARIKRLAGGKTGTNDGPRDAWFVGFTHDLVTGVWIGNDDNRIMPFESGGRTPARIWKAIMSTVPPSTEQAGFPLPEQAYVNVRTCPVSGQVATPTCPSPLNLSYLEHEAPAHLCVIHPQHLPRFHAKEESLPSDGTYSPQPNPHVSRIRKAFGEPEPLVERPSP